jgi:Tfp pilus assembly protein PilF
MTDGVRSGPDLDSSTTDNRAPDPDAPTIETRVRRKLVRAWRELDGGRSKNAIEYFTEIIQLAPQCFEAYCGRGRAYYTRQQYQNAYIDFTNAIKINPSDYEVREQRSRALRGLGRENDAAVEYAIAGRMRMAQWDSEDSATKE